MPEVFVIFEMQTGKDGAIAHLPPVNVFDKDEAWSAYYQKLSFAIVSPVYIHTVMLCTNDGRVLDSKSYVHGVNE